MVARSFFAFDSEAFFVTGDSPFLEAGSSIINNSNTPVGTVFQYDASFESSLVELDDTSGSADILEDDQEGGHVVTNGGSLVDDGAQIEAESFHYLQQQDEFGNPIGDVVSVTVFSQGGVTQDVWGFSSDAALVDGATYVKVGGSNLGSSEYASFVPCFVVGTDIVTDQGLKKVEDLREGDRVLTRDNGFQPLLWAGKRHIHTPWLETCPHLRPIQIKAGSFGEGCPERDLYVSPQHRVLISDNNCDLYFGSSEVLTAADFLTEKAGFSQTKCAEVTYVHLLFEQHQVVLSNGLWTESFQPGKCFYSQGDRKTFQEISEIFPDLNYQNCGQYNAARTVLKRRESAMLFA